MADGITGAASRVLVGLNNPATMPQLLEIGSLLAGEVGGGLQAFCVVGRRGGDSSFASRLLGLAAHHCAESGALVPEPMLVAADSLQEGILEAVGRVKPTHLVLGYSPHREEDLQGERALTRALQQVARGYAGHLLIAHFGEATRGHRVLAPVAAEANLELLGQLGRALLRREGASLTLCRVVPEEADTAGHHEAMAFLRSVAEQCGFLGEVSFRVASSGDVAEGILAAAWEFDGIIVGMTRTRSLTERLLGSISDQVATWARCTTYLIRARKG